MKEKNVPFGMFSLFPSGSFPIGKIRLVISKIFLYGKETQGMTNDPVRAGFWCHD
jgi:hypothetical protein